MGIGLVGSMLGTLLGRAIKGDNYQAHWVMSIAGAIVLLVVFPLRAHKVVGTDIFHAAALLYVAGAAHWAAGNVDFGILGWLLLGSIPGVLIGGRLTLSIPWRHLRRLLP